MPERNPIIVTAGVVVRDGKVLVAKRKKGSHLEGLWEFPGGKLEPNESPEECLARELKEELGVDVRIGDIQKVVYHRYAEKTVLLLFYACELTNGTPQPLEVEEMAWVKRSELLELEWVPADIRFVRKLAEGR
jgi:8-oxo-dGTP diphosphatase